MTNTISISFELNTSNDQAELGFEAWVDDGKFVDIDHVQGRQLIKIDMSDTDGEHTLEIILKNKKEMHTKIDADGNIVSDAVLNVSDLAFDEIKLGHMVTKLATYIHNFNGTKELTQEQFYGEMGCNGTVSLKFTTPIYLWLLENM
jgi:hypothetical protein